MLITRRMTTERIFAALCFIAAFPLNALAGDVTGTVKFEGEVPQLKPLNLDADPDCKSKHSTPPMSEALVLGPGNTMGNVFVSVKGVPAKDYPTPSEPAVVAQHGCIYVPHVLGIMKGQKIKFKNDDGILHNVHALPKVNPEFNLGMPATMKEAEKEFNKPEPLFNVKCDVHPWMQAYVAVMEHPFFAVTGADGTFTIKGLPAGTYEVEAWHEKLKTQTVKVTVADGAPAKADFVFKRQAG